MTRLRIVLIEIFKFEVSKSVVSFKPTQELLLKKENEFFKVRFQKVWLLFQIPNSILSPKNTS